MWRGDSDAGRLRVSQQTGGFRNVDVADWLHRLGLGQYEQAFRDNAVDGEVLPRLTADDLKDLGVSAIGHRRKLLDAIAALGVEPASDQATNQAAQITPEQDTSERRQVTVLFADLAGYTALSRELDSEEVHALLAHFFSHVDRIIDEHGGYIDKHVGDCVMAVFGAPVAHGNDAERAVRAALTVRDIMPTVSAAVGRPVRVHVGVAAGQVVASGSGSERHREYTVTGDSVNLASRLADTAKAGEIVISEMVQRALADRLECEPAETLAVKGFAAPVTTWRLRALRSLSDRGPLVGRRGELREFQAVLDACVEIGRGQAVCLRGEAGIGKTRLLEGSRTWRARPVLPVTPPSFSISAPEPVGTSSALGNAASRPRLQLRPSGWPASRRPSGSALVTPPPIGVTVK